MVAAGLWATPSAKVRGLAHQAIFHVVGQHPPSSSWCCTFAESLEVQALRCLLHEVLPRTLSVLEGDGLDPPEPMQTTTTALRHGASWRATSSCGA